MQFRLQDVDICRDISEGKETNKKEKNNIGKNSLKPHRNNQIINQILPVPC